jgi:Domain of unknown function (DUF5666)
MQKRTFTIMSRSVASLAMGMAITAGSATLASASGQHHGLGNCASAKLSAFDYGRWGTGGYVTAVTATSVTVQLWDGTTTTFTLDPSTTYTEGGSSAAISALAVGDRVQVQTASGSSTTASSVNIELAELFGKVTAVSGNDITISDPQGFSRTIVVNSATSYTDNGATGSLTNVVVGAKVFAAGTIDANGTSLDAVKVAVGVPAHNEFIRGTITAVSGTSITVSGGHHSSSSSSTYAITTNTKFNEGKTSLASSQLAVGQHVTVEVSSATPTTASSISVDPTVLGGTVTAVSGNVITIKDNQGFTRTIDVNAATTYGDGHAAGSLTDVTVGANIWAAGLIDANGATLDAQSVNVVPSNQGGAQPGLRGHVGAGFGGNHSLVKADVSGGSRSHAEGNANGGGFGHGGGRHHSFGGGFGRR